MEAGPELMVPVSSKLVSGTLVCRLSALCKLQAKVKGKLGQPQVAEYDLDVLGRQKEMSLPTMDNMDARRTAGGSTGNMQGLANMQQPGLSDALRSRLASLLATEFSKKARC